jgi:hypothetical protein
MPIKATINQKHQEKVQMYMRLYDSLRCQKLVGCSFGSMALPTCLGCSSDDDDDGLMMMRASVVCMISNHK